MSRLHISPQVFQASRTFAEVTLGAVALVVSLITAAVLSVVWFVS